MPRRKKRDWSISHNKKVLFRIYNKESINSKKHKEWGN